MTHQDTRNADNNGKPSISISPNEDNSSAKLILYDSIGSGASGQVFDADLQLNDLTLGVVAKFFDPKAFTDEEGSYISEEDMSEWMFKNETEAYRRLSGSSICLPFYGAFRGIGFTGFETGLILLEKLSETFHQFSDMTMSERQTAYNHVLELHRRSIHHGDVEPRNFGWIGLSFADSATSSDVEETEGEEKESEETGYEEKRGEQPIDSASYDEGSLIVYDFSHSSVFTDCDPERCFDLRRAKNEIIDLSDGRGYNEEA